MAILSVASFVALFCYSLVHLVQMSSSLRNEIGESNLWIVTQAERETQALLVTLDSFGSEYTFDDVLMRLDILYSRINLASVAPQNAYLESLGAGEPLRAVQEHFTLVDDYLSQGADPAYVAAARSEVREMARALREITNITFLHERTERFARRKEQSRVMVLLMVSSGGLFALGLIISMLMWRNLSRALNAQQQLELHRAALEVTIAARTAELREALAVERRANDIYQSFIVTVSHQFRTPVSIIHMITQRLLRRDDLEEALRPKLQRVFEAAERMERLLSGFLASASSHKGQEIVRKPLDFRQVVTAAVAQVGMASPERILATEITGEPVTIEGEAILLEQAVLNLLTNAVKYSEAPTPVAITLRRTAGEAVLTVADRGIGIPADVGSAIFDRFFRAANVHNVQGAGVGLAFSRETIALHGGEITFSGREGGGTEFTVTLPLSGGRRAATTPSDDPVHRG